MRKIVVCFLFALLHTAVNSECLQDYECVAVKECKGGGEFVYPCFNNHGQGVCCEREHVIQRISESALKTHNCGIFANADKITGGSLAALGQFPWMALLGYKQSGLDFVQYLCGGSVISDQYILTAAHCLSIDSIYKLVEVRLGELNLETAIDCEGKFNETCGDPPLDIPVKRIVAHASYNSKNLQNDIALIQLQTKIKFTAYIQPICLPFNENVSHNRLRDQTLIVSGWGKTDSINLGGSTRLQYAYVTVWNQERCFTSVPVDVKPIKDTQLCANGHKREDACKGDSGGPLINNTFFKSDFRGLQIGIVSFASAQICGNPELPTVYTKVDQYLPWILENVT